MAVRRRQFCKHSGKVGYDRRKHALEAARKQQRKFRINQRAYLCEHCKDYHLTTMSLNDYKLLSKT